MNEFRVRKHTTLSHTSDACFQKSVRLGRIGLPSIACFNNFVRDARIELASDAWEASILPLNESRTKLLNLGNEMSGRHFIILPLNDFIQKLYTLWVFYLASLVKCLTRSCESVPRFLTRTYFSNLGTEIVWGTISASCHWMIRSGLNNSSAVCKIRKTPAPSARVFCYFLSFSLYAEYFTNIYGDKIIHQNQYRHLNHHQEDQVQDS